MREDALPPKEMVSALPTDFFALPTEEQEGSQLRRTWVRSE